MENQDGHKYLTTREAARELRLQEQTLRKWSHFDNGPIRPVRVARRLLWAVADVKRLLEGRK